MKIESPAQTILAAIVAIPDNKLPLQAKKIPPAVPAIADAISEAKTLHKEIMIAHRETKSEKITEIAAIPNDSHIGLPRIKSTISKALSRLRLFALELVALHTV